jgi:mannose-6-phosphate isomerase-like protein (cupin superfamily)
VVRTTGDPVRRQGLLSIADVDILLKERGARLPAVRIVRDGQTVPTSLFTTSARIGSKTVSDLLDPALIAAQFANGATISLQGLHRYWQPLTELCQLLEAALSHPFQANAYLSPPGATGLQVHHDTHDVFVLQVEGSKHFDVYEPAIRLPVAGQHWTSDEPPGEPVISVDLKPGDCLYMPRGWRHRAFTTDSHSLHLTIGLLGYTWLGLASALSAELADEPSFREPLPPGFANDPDALTATVTERLAALRSWLDGADPAALADTLTRRFVTARAATPSGISALVREQTIGTDTRVHRRRFARCLLRPADARIELVLADRTVSFPAVASVVLRAILEAESFTAADLPDDLDLAGRLVVVRRLVAEGLLEAG